MDCQKRPKWGMPHDESGEKLTSSTVSTTGGFAKSGRTRLAESILRSLEEELYFMPVLMVMTRVTERLAKAPGKHYHVNTKTDKQAFECVNGIIPKDFLAR